MLTFYSAKRPEPKLTMFVELHAHRVGVGPGRRRHRTGSRCADAVTWMIRRHPRRIGSDIGQHDLEIAPPKTCAVHPRRLETARTGIEAEVVCGRAR